MLENKGTFRITTLCIGRVCVGYRSALDGSSVSDYAAVAAVFSATFFGVWVLVMMVFVICETVQTMWRMRLRESERERREGEGVYVVGEMLRLHAEMDERCPLRVMGRRLGDLECGEGGCAVCLEALDAGDVGRKLGCGHLFHASCIDRWVLQTLGKGRRGGKCEAVCPLCKYCVVGEQTRLKGDEESGIGDWERWQRLGHSEGYEVVYDEAVLQVS